MVADGGISWQVLYTSFSKVEVAVHGEVTIWAFSREGMYRGGNRRWLQIYDNQVFSRAISTLFALQLLECVPHLTQSASLDSEIKHAVAGLNTTSALDCEVELSLAANSTGWTLLTPLHKKMIKDGPLQHALLVPAQHHMSKVHCYGIYRPKYRPETALTAEWTQQSHKTAEVYVPLYERWESGGDRMSEGSSIDNSASLNSPTICAT